MVARPVCLEAFARIAPFSRPRTSGYTVWLFYVLLKRTVSVRAALVGTALLAVDPVFVLTSRWDWGPVVLQHLCLVGGMLAFVIFAREGQTRWLAVGAFVFGLGMWDKAIFLWSLVGLGTAAIVVFPRTLLHRLRPD
jgi:predicted membrane-bound mannosyltransferase